MPSKSLSSLLIISASLSLAAITIIPVYHEASAKECNNNDNGHNNDDGSGCSDNHDSNSNSDHNNKHSDDGNSAKKDKTPFVLAQPMPFP